MTNINVATRTMKSSRNPVKTQTTELKKKKKKINKIPKLSFTQRGAQRHMESLNPNVTASTLSSQSSKKKRSALCSNGADGKK